MESVSAIVVSYETREALARCLEALRRENLETIVVDNASRDGSADMVLERFPEVKLLALERNIGFGAGCNVGARCASQPYILFLNPDTTVHVSAVRALVACCETSSTTAGAIPQLVDEHGCEAPAVERYPTKWWRGAPPMTSVASRRSAKPDSPEVLVGEFAVGAALLVRRDAFDRVGGFDAGFFLFYEDVDLCRRLQDDGWDIRRCPGAEVVHLGGAATRLEWPVSYREQLRGHLRFIYKHEGRREAAISRLVLMVSVFARYAFSRGVRRRGFKKGLAWLARVDLDSVAAPAPPDSGITANVAASS